MCVGGNFPILGCRSWMGKPVDFNDQMKENIRSINSMALAMRSNDLTMTTI